MVRGVKNYLLTLLVFVLAAAFVYSWQGQGTASADGTKYLSGHAWSSNIGWVSFSSVGSLSGATYQVTYDPVSGYLSGHAWSSNIGWISFGCGQVDGSTGRKICAEDLSNPKYPIGFGTVGSGPRIDGATGKLVGFARACSVFVSGCSGILKSQSELGGWDGWISLSGSTSDLLGEYKVTIDSLSSSSPVKKFSGFAWGGGQDLTTPQFIGWLHFGPFDNLSGGGGGGLIGNGGVILCDALTCEGKVTPPPSPLPKVSCSRNPNIVVIGSPVVWTATVDIPNVNYTYLWSVTSPNSLASDYSVVGGSLLSQSVTLNYKVSGSWVTDVMVKDGNKVIGNCGTSTAGGGGSSDITRFVVGEKTFNISHAGDMNAKFIRSINTVTFPDTPISIIPVGNFIDPVTIRFVEIRDKNGNVKAADGDSGRALLVEPEFWIDPLAAPSSTITLNKLSGGYESATLRLRITKNQDSSDTSLPTGDYNVFIDFISGGHSHPIILHLNNPSGGVVEL